MSFSDRQKSALNAKLRHKFVRTRLSDGRTIPYLEGWHVIAEANRIFGYENWDRRTLAPRCAWQHTQRGITHCFYTTKVCITVRAGPSVVVREGIGTGFGKASLPELAHEIALKAAETDATKRALATFGNPFGLALYDKGQANVTRPATARTPMRPRSDKDTIKPQTFTLLINGEEKSFQNLAVFVDEVAQVAATLNDLEALYGFWEANLLNFGKIAQTKQIDPQPSIDAIVSNLRNRARALSAANAKLAEQSGAEDLPPERGANLNGQLVFPKEQRLRNKEHLRSVASRPCLVCGRRPAQAHHLRFVQPRAMGLKVSDEYTVPLCALHHDAVHRHGNEQSWWIGQAIDPLKVAEELWSETRNSEKVRVGNSDG
jgi:hypothetical protein